MAASYIKIIDKDDRRYVEFYRQAQKTTIRVERMEVTGQSIDDQKVAIAAKLEEIRLTHGRKRIYSDNRIP